MVKEEGEDRKNEVADGRKQFFSTFYFLLQRMSCLSYGSLCLYFELTK